jgi:poly-gamma-glutamate synthesis protein (capsule biosynthesis protein)
VPSIVATGDLMPQRAPGPAAGELLGDGDIAFVNLEGPLTDAGAPTDTVARVRGERWLAAGLAAAGVQVATVANNHAMDFGAAGLLDCVAALGEAGIAAVGGGPDLVSALEPALVQAGGLTFAFLGLTSTLPNGSAAGDRRAGLAPVRVISRFVVDPVVIDQNPGMAPYVETVAGAEDVERACAAVRRARERADVVVVGIHWGVPDGWVPAYQSELADYQRPLGHALIDAGADAVIGHHPHVLHGIELHRGRPVFHSLGNFLFHVLLSGELELTRPYPAYDFATLRARIGGVARLHWTRPGPPERIELGIVSLDTSGEPARASPEDAASGFARVDALSRRLGAGLSGRGSWREIGAR